jgi:hypothetical protein
LTSAKSTFIDIRFPKKRAFGRPIAEDPSFWAFSGKSTLEFITSDDPTVPVLPYSAHGAWGRDIDSKGGDVVDEGDIFMLPNGDCIEVGMMENPATHKVEMYKEYWSVPSPASPSRTETELSRFPCIVARELSSDQRAGVGAVPKGSGAVIRIGDFCQGVMRQQPVSETGASSDGNAVWVERWVRNQVAPQHSPGVNEVVKQHSDDDSWTQDWRSNTPSDSDPYMPCIWVCAPDRKLGDEVVLNSAVWRVVEAVSNNAGLEAE